MSSGPYRSSGVVNVSCGHVVSEGTREGRVRVRKSEVRVRKSEGAQGGRASKIKEDGRFGCCGEMSTAVMASCSMAKPAHKFALICRCYPACPCAR
eukprot:365370-Chlamydomonas_euryale.AAC.4